MVPPAATRLNFVCRGDDEWGAILSREHSVRLVVLRERLALGIHLQPIAQPQPGLAVDLDLVVVQVRQSAFKRLQVLVGAFHRSQAGLDLFQARFFAQPVGDVARVAKRARQVALQDVRVQVLILAAADGLNKVGEVVFVFATVKLLDLLAALVERAPPV